MAEAALSKTQRKNAKKRAKEAGTWKKLEAPETGVHYELFQMLREEYLGKFNPGCREEGEEHIAYLARHNYVASYYTLNLLAQNCFNKLRKIPELCTSAVILQDAIHDTLDKFDEKHKATPPVAMNATVEKLSHPSPSVTETAPVGVIKSKKVTQGTAPPHSKQEKQQDTQSLRQQIYDEASATHKDKDSWAPSFEKAVDQVSTEYNLQVPLEEYQQSMCRLGRAMLKKELLRKTVAIIKYKETMKKYKQMKK